MKDKKDGYEEIENKMKEGEVISSSTFIKVLKEYIINSLNTKNFSIWISKKSGTYWYLGKRNER